MLILPGHIDLSAGSGVGFVGGVSAVLIVRYALPAELAGAYRRRVWSVLWRFQGVVIVRQGIPAFIITLGGFWPGAVLAVHPQPDRPVSPGGSNLLSVLTTTYLPPRASYVRPFALSRFWRFDGRSHKRTTRDALAHGESPPDYELPFLRRFCRHKRWVF